MVIDIHGHLGASWLAWAPNRVDADGLVRLYDEFGVDKACISSWLIYYDPPAGNDEIYRACQKHPDRFIGFAVVSPRYGKEAVKEIDRCVQELGMKGLGELHPSISSWHADSPAVDPIMERARHYNLPVLLHSWSDSYSHPRAIGNVAARFPDVTIIMAHMGFDEWFEAIQVAKQHPNLMLDTAGTLSEVIVLKTAVEEIGSHRVFFGSDAPALNLGAELAKVKHGIIPEEGKALILGENARLLLKL